MAKRAKKASKPYIDWNRLTVSDIQGIITHFAEQELYYRQHEAQCQFLGESSGWSSSIPVMQSRQKFWHDMLHHVTRGEKIAAHVRDYIKYNQHRGEY